MNWIFWIIVIIVVSNIWYYGTGQDKKDAAKKRINKDTSDKASNDRRISGIGPINIHDNYGNVTFELKYAWYFYYKEEKSLFLQLSFICKNHENLSFLLKQQRQLIHMDIIKTQTFMPY